MVQLIDSHSHIHFQKDFPDIDQVMRRSLDAGVMKQILIGCNLKDSFVARRFAEINNGVGGDFFWTIGVHPHDAAGFDVKKKVEFEENLRKEKADHSSRLRGIGECGLDYFRNLSPINLQKEVFIWQIEQAKRFDLPLVVHIRDAYNDAFEILQEAGRAGVKKIVLHCFSGGLNEAYQAWNEGWITSFSGVVTYPKNEELRQCAKEAPDDLIVVETDCPYLAPQKYRGQRNEPAFVAETARVIAEVRGEDFEKFAELSTKNAERFFKI